MASRTAGAGQEKRGEVNFWDKIAGERIYAAFSEKEYNRIFDDNLGEGRRGVALDIGCASGVSAVILARRGFAVKGIDVSPNLIAQANKIWSGEKNKPEFSVADAESLPIEEGSCDVCFLGGVIHHFPDSRKVIDEIHRVLKPGGKLLMIEPNALDVVERISWFFAGRLNLLSPNEYPVSPVEMSRALEGRFGNFRTYPIRTDDIPFFSFLPFVGRFFKGGKGRPAKKVPLFFLNLFRPALHSGNFFVLSCEKAQR